VVERIVLVDARQALSKELVYSFLLEWASLQDSLKLATRGDVRFISVAFFTTHAQIGVPTRMAGDV